MKFDYEQRWNAPPDAIVEIYLDESFWSDLSGLSTTSPPTVLGLERSGDRAVVRLHYVLDVDLPREAGRFIDTDNVAWVEQTTWNLADGSASVEFQPSQAAALMRASARSQVRADGSDTVRSIRGEVKVHIPLLGGRVEKVIVEGVNDHLSEEADAVRARLG